MRVAVAVWRLEANRHLPALTGAQSLRLTLQIQRHLRGLATVIFKLTYWRDQAGLFSRLATKTCIPSQINLRGQVHRLVIQTG